MPTQHTDQLQMRSDTSENLDSSDAEESLEEKIQRVDQKGLVAFFTAFGLYLVGGVIALFTAILYYAYR